MTQEERWKKKYQDVMDFMEKNHRNPSRHRLEEHDMLNWVKQQRKLKNKGELKAERAEMLERLLSLCIRTLVRKVYYNLSTKIRTGHKRADGKNRCEEERGEKSVDTWQGQGEDDEGHSGLILVFEF